MPSSRINPFGKRFVLLLGLLAATLLTFSQTGCSLFVMAGKMLMGDPLITSPFEQMSKVNLVKDQKKVLVICSTPEYIKNDYPSLNFDLTDGIITKMKRRGIEVVDSSELTSWFDENGGKTDYKPSELAQQFDVDYIVRVDLDRFDYREENSPQLFRGRANGQASAYEVRKQGDHKFAVQVFVREVQSVYPAQHPVFRDQSGTPKTFRKRYLDIVSNEVASYFYDTRPSEHM